MKTRQKKNKIRNSVPDRKRWYLRWKLFSEGTAWERT